MMPGLLRVAAPRVRPMSSPAAAAELRRTAAAHQAGAAGPSMLLRHQTGQKLVLASGSPRRVTLINQAGIEPDALRPVHIDETPKRGELPRACANRLARAKADAALDMVRTDEELEGAYILAADTVVAVGRRILPKAELLDEAAQCLRQLSGAIIGSIPRSTTRSWSTLSDMQFVDIVLT